MFDFYRIMRHRIGVDGEGVTSLIGLMGCPLACKYCLNKKMLMDKRHYEISAGDLLGMVMQDACYMIATNGGVTFGGGEPLLQYKDIIEFAKIKPDWMHINIETALHAPSEIVRGLLPYVDHWIVDIKSLDKDVYEQYTRGSLKEMSRSLGVLADCVPEKCTIRVPIIPGFKDKAIAVSEEQLLRDKGFENIDVFEYVK